MSRHSIESKNYFIGIGVDAPLSHVFATVLDKKGKPAKGFKQFVEYPLSKDGVKEAVDTVNTFVGKSEPSWGVPSVIVEKLHDDLEIYLDHDGEIGGLHTYKSQSD